MSTQAGTSRATDGHGRAAVFLDRDGVLVRAEVRDGKSYAVRRLEDFRLLPGAAEAVRTLRDHGFLIIVVTNQPDIGNGLVAADVVAAQLAPYVTHRTTGRPHVVLKLAARTSVR